MRNMEDKNRKSADGMKFGGRGNNPEKNSNNPNAVHPSYHFAMPKIQILDLSHIGVVI